MSRPLTVLALVWTPFLSIFFFASQGDTSALHISSHVLALALLVPATTIVWRMRSASVLGIRRWIVLGLLVTVSASVVGHVGELAVAVQRLAQDGWVNKDTHDIWEGGAHLMISNLTIPATMLSMLLSVALVVATAMRGRRADSSPKREVSRVG